MRTTSLCRRAVRYIFFYEDGDYQALDSVGRRQDKICFRTRAFRNQLFFDEGVSKPIVLRRGRFETNCSWTREISNKLRVS